MTQIHAKPDKQSQWEKGYVSRGYIISWLEGIRAENISQLSAVWQAAQLTVSEGMK